MRGIHIAAYYGYVEEMALLLKHGADVNRKSTDSSSSSPGPWRPRGPVLAPCPCTACARGGPGRGRGGPGGEGVEPGPPHLCTTGLVAAPWAPWAPARAAPAFPGCVPMAGRRDLDFVLGFSRVNSRKK